MNHAEELDYWNDETEISVDRLETLPLRVQPVAGEPDKVIVGRLFTAAMHMASENGGDIKVCVTGFLRATMDLDSPRDWAWSDCYAPRNHSNGVPPIRLLTYPSNMGGANGLPLPAIELSRLVADRMANDDNWRAQICSDVESVTPEAIRVALGIEEKPETVSQPSGSVQEQEITPREPADREIDLDSDDLEAGDSQPDRRKDETESETAQADAIDLDDDGDDVGSLVDQWDEEDRADDNLSDLGLQSRTEETLDSMIDLDDDSGIEAGKPTANEPYSRQEHIAQRFGWAEQAESEDSPAQKPMPEVAEVSLEEPEATEEQVEPAAHKEQPRVESAALPSVSKPILKAVTSEAPSDKKAESSEGTVPLREHVLFNSTGYDVAFLGHKHGESALSNGSGEKGALFKTKGGLLVVHVDEESVVTIKPEEKDRLYEMMGYHREAKELYASAGVNCVRWLD